MLMVHDTASRSARTRLRRQAGLTLIELMIVIVVIGILAAVAIPSYREYILRSHRNAAQAFLQDVASRQAQYLLDARAYATSISALGLTTPNDLATRYTFSPTATNTASGVAFTVQAIPIGPQAGERCGTLSIDSAGAKAATGSSPVGCW
jgi:type IV pilus assembly protein PilE